MINTNYSTINSGRFNTAHHAPIAQNQGFTQQASGLGSPSSTLGLLQLIFQLLQQISGAQQQPSNGDSASGHASNHDCANQGGNATADGQSGQAIQSAQAFNTPVGATEPGPASNGGVYEFTVQARPGQNLSFATMLAATNDQFIAPNSNGISLFDEFGRPREGDITGSLAVWDGGTEANEAVGNGANQPANQAGPNTGPADAQNFVRRSEEGVAPIGQLVDASLTHNGNGSFTVRIENISGQNGGAAIPITPGVATVHDQGVNPFFTEGQMDRGAGLESLAEDGDPMQLLASLQAQIEQGLG